MNSDPLDSITTRLREGIAGTGDVGAAPEGRDDAILRLRTALDRRAARLRWRKRAAWTIAAACVAAGTFALAFRREMPPANNLGRVHAADGVAAVVDGQAVPLGAGSRVSEGTELRTPAGAAAELDYDTGTRVTIAGATRVRLIEQRASKRFAIEAGAFSAHVAKLGPSERFIVATPDAEVEVRGTVFRVTVVPPDPACGGGTPTRLEVTEGVVVLRREGVELSVAAGARWPQCASAEPPPSVDRRWSTSAAPPAATAPTVPVTTRAPLPTSSPRSSEVPPSPSPESSLAEQNDLFDTAMRGKRAGRTAEALARLERLRARYPAGPLAETAEVERMRLLTGAAKARAARDYLERWPRGFARAEAETLAGGP
jgi:hypothetical protein